MVIDSAATPARLRPETRLMSVTNFVKIGLKMFFRKGTLGLPEIELSVMRANIKLVAVDEQQAYAAGPPPYGP